MNGTTLTLYDFLNYVVIGALMLLTCNIKPNTINEWLYFVLAYIVGLIIVKLHENTFWYSCVRNPRHLIESAEKELDNNKKDKNSYLKNYYRIFGDKVATNIRILEAQFAFVMNLMIPMAIFLLMFSFCKEKIVAILNLGSFDVNCNCCCCQILSIEKNIYICPLALTIIVLAFGTFIEYLKNCDNKGKEQYRLLPCIILFSFLVVLFTYTLYSYSFTFRGNNLTLQRIGATLGIIFVLLPFIAYRIQKKISILVVEGGHYIEQNPKKEIYYE